MVGGSNLFEVLLAAGAEQGLESIYDHIAEFDCLANASPVLDQLMKVVGSLAQLPRRGSYPKELVG